MCEYLSLYSAADMEAMENWFHEKCVTFFMEPVAILQDVFCPAERKHPLSIHIVAPFLLRVDYIGGEGII